MLKDVLRLIEEGTSNPKEIAKKLGVEEEKVLGAIEILKSLGYLKSNEQESCSACPLKNLCPTSCSPGDRVLYFELSR
ncbi:DNA-binding protein [Thermococcus indicus]|uniref:DNA-binding protein n=1 Tax=Thermococcus indicus TaxID=2586643 RepID=A0A4Y5SKA0_9EURY|nr:DNA-binding protein [Thermococcus indicus]QDA31377.1 DNA-binding protein [Thermococcus indicus]